MTNTCKIIPTPEMIAAAWAAWNVRHGGKLGPGPAFREAIEAALAAAPEQKPAVRVKPLGWDDRGRWFATGKFIVSSAQTPFGYYGIVSGTQGKYSVYFGTSPWTGSFKTIAEAKAAAQADYERRILSAIDPQSSDEITALKAENERLREAVRRVTATYANMEDGNGDPCPDIAFANSALKGAVRAPQRQIVDDEMEILKRLADGDTIRFSQDGDAAWFTKGDGAFVGDAIISLRSKGYLKRECDDEENYRGMAEYDTISDLGRAALNGGDQ